MRLRLRTRGKLMFANFRLKICQQSETPTSKTDLLIFLSAGTIYIRFLIYLKAVDEQKMKEIDFSTLAPQLRFWSIIFLTVAPRRHVSMTSMKLRCRKGLIRSFCTLRAEVSLLHGEPCRRETSARRVIFLRLCFRNNLEAMHVLSIPF